MGSLEIEAAKSLYGGATEEEMLRNMAKKVGCRRIYKYANDYGDKKTHTDYFRVEVPGDEENIKSSPYVHNVVLVYDNGDYYGS